MDHTEDFGGWGVKDVIPLVLHRGSLLQVTNHLTLAGGLASSCWMRRCYFFGKINILYLFGYLLHSTVECLTHYIVLL